jgi:hypothetical protein
MTRSSNAQRAQRINAALVMMQKYDTLADAATALAKAYAMSQRQAYRYLREAKLQGKSVPVPEEKIVFTVKLPHGLVHQLRQRAHQRGESLSELVAQALTGFLGKGRRRGR